MNERPRPPEDAPFEKPRISMAVFGILLACGAISVLLWLGVSKLASSSIFFVTATPTATTVSTPTSMPTATLTRTPRPTPTTTPIPTWVTDYVEPVLAALVNERPHFQDDFSEESVSWRFDSDAQGEIEIKNGVLVATIRQMGTEIDAYYAIHPAMRFQNFALRFEVDLSGLGSGDAARIHWRGTSTSRGIGFDLWKDGRWQVFASDPLRYLAEGYQTIDATREVTITIISRDTEYAIYIYETLVSYINDRGRTPGIGISLGVLDDPGSPTVVTFDNLKAWDLDKIQIQP